MEKNKSAPIVEVYKSIQGEGISLGKPSIFVRFWGCNLRCKFDGEICDTPQGIINPEKATKITTNHLAAMIRLMDCPHIVFTGGEPSLYQMYILELMNKLKNYTCEIETNGTIPIIHALGHKVNLFNVSVKLSSSNQTNKAYDKLRINYDALDSFPIDKSCFKFVVSSNKDMKEILDLHEKYKNIPVLLMPEGITRDKIIEHSERVVNLCMKYNFIYCPREHIMIWDNKKGV